jgi:hypothetical protein
VGPSSRLPAVHGEPLLPPGAARCAPGACRLLTVKAARAYAAAARVANAIVAATNRPAAPSENRHAQPWLLHLRIGEALPDVGSPGRPVTHCRIRGVAWISLSTEMGARSSIESTWRSRPAPRELEEVDRRPQVAFLGVPAPTALYIGADAHGPKASRHQPRASATFGHRRPQPTDLPIAAHFLAARPTVHHCASSRIDGHTATTSPPSLRRAPSGRASDTAPARPSVAGRRSHNFSALASACALLANARAPGPAAVRRSASTAAITSAPSSRPTPSGRTLARLTARPRAWPRCRPSIGVHRGHNLSAFVSAHAFWPHPCAPDRAPARLAPLPSVDRRPPRS